MMSSHSSDGNISSNTEHHPTAATSGLLVKLTIPLFSGRKLKKNIYWGDIIGWLDVIISRVLADAT